jgi:hypothetical protein
MLQHPPCGKVGGDHASELAALRVRTDVLIVLYQCSLGLVRDDGIQEDHLRARDAEMDMGRKIVGRIHTYRYTKQSAQ